jgi:cobalt-zinc-cadmium efflux system membrane fusion protein
MKHQTILQYSAVITLTAVLILVGCRQGTEHAEDDGHGHGRHEHGESPQAAPAAAGAKCAPHGAPKELCFLCDPTLRDAGRLWCAEHARYEDRCWICHPELEDKSRRWCAEHSLHEEECFLCRPELKGTSPAASSGTDLMCAEHGVLEAQCGICRPETIAALKPGGVMQVRLPSARSADIAGVETALPVIGGVTEAIECYAEIDFDQNKLAQIASPVGGIIEIVSADLGDQVAEGQTVARVWSASIAEAVAKAVLTHQTLERERKLREGRVSSEKDLQEAEAAHRAACQQLRTLGFSEEKIDELSHTPQESVLLDVTAPFGGEIVERSAVRGALVEGGKSLFTVTDRSMMWAMLNIPELALSAVRAGQSVELRVDSLPGRVFIGKLTWIGAEVNDRTRMARARVEVPNADGALRARMFARARILVRQAQSGLLVPESAVHRLDGKALVFVKREDDLFEARAVLPGVKFDGLIEIVEGLKSDEQVAVAHGFALKSQLLISRLGAGCAHD